MTHDAIIIGAGPAGVAAAVQCTRLGLQIVLIDKQGVAGGLIANAHSIENYPGLPEPIDGLAFQKHLASFLCRFDIPVYRETARSISCAAADTWEVETSERTLKAKTLVVATGTVPKMLPFLGREKIEDACRLYYEVAPLLKQHTNPGPVVIIGGGEASLDYALSIARTGNNATVLCRGYQPVATGRLLRMAKENANIQILPNSELIRATFCAAHHGEVDDGAEDDFNDRIQVEIAQSVTCCRFAKLNCHTIIVAIGRAQNTQSLFVDSFSGLNSLTPAKGLFICGDARLGSLGQVGIAVGDGLEAAMKIATYIGSFC